MLASLRTPLCALGLMTFAFAGPLAGGCGGKTIEDLDAGSDASSPTPTTSTPMVDSGPPAIDAGGRVCPPTCTSGHQCCINNCGGLPAPMPNGCCSCLPTEVSSEMCGGKCGG